MHIKSPFPEVPPILDVNVYHSLWNRPDQEQWPQDFIFHVDGRTGERRTYRDVYERSRLGATALGAPVSEGGLGIDGQDREIVGIMSQNMSDFVTIVHSLLAITTPFVLIPSYSTPFELEHIFGLTKLTRLFVNAHLLPTVLPVANANGISQGKIYVLGGEAPGRDSFSEMIDRVKRRGTLLVPIRPATKDTLAFLILSSGTTGLPKAVMTSHGNLVFFLQQFATVVAMQPPKPPGAPETPTYLATLPMHHSYGLQVCCFLAFLVPQTFVILSRWNLEVALRTIAKYKISGLLLVPSHVHQIVNYSRLDEVDLSTVQSIGSGGALLPPEIAAKLSSVIRHGFSLSQGYGMSEITGGAILQPAQGNVEGATGVLLPSLEARVVRDDGSEADVDEVGELYLKGRSVTLGYLGNPEATRGRLLMVGCGQETYSDFIDRAKDTLKVSGAQVSPNEIENVLLSEPKKLISDVCVVGVSGGRTFDEKVPRAWIALSEAGKKMGAEETVKLLDKWHRENLTKYKWLRGGFEIVDQIPKSPTGKVLRRVLRDEHERKVSTRLRGKL